MEAQRREHDILPILQDPALPRTEAQRRGLDILQILQALLDIGNPTENAPEHLPLSAHEMWDLQQHHRSLISHLYVFLPILILTRQQEPYRAKLGRVGRTLLIELLSFCHSRDVALPDSIHAQYFGHLWTSPVPGCKRKASSQAADWADTLSIWIHPGGTLARNLGHRDEQDEEGEPLTDLEHQALMDEDSQRLGLTLLNLLNTEPKTNPLQGDVWKGFMLALSFSGDLLTSLIHAVTNPLADDLNILSLQGVGSLYREFLEVKRWMRDGPAVQNMITLLISKGLLSKVLEKTRLYSQVEGSQLNKNTADLLLTLSLRAHTSDARIRMELSRVIHILSGGWTGQIQDLLTGWLKDALFRFPWICPPYERPGQYPYL